MASMESMASKAPMGSEPSKADVLVGVFVGGASRRMGGRPKGLLEAPGGDEPLLARRLGNPLEVVNPVDPHRGRIGLQAEGVLVTLIEDGILVGYMQDRQNARLMGMKPTGNGRRQSYAHIPMPRMTNTYMLAGDKDPAEILASVKKGIYAVNFGGGQVDITSGKFVFSCTEAYLIEDGKVGPAVKGATLIGNGPDVMTKVSMIGNDLALDPGIGTCGKDGQGVPVGVGQPTMLIDGITVGGTAA